MIPLDDLKWALSQKPSLQQLFLECWATDPYGSRWMQLSPFFLGDWDFFSDCDMIEVLFLLVVAPVRLESYWDFFIFLRRRCDRLPKQQSPLQPMSKGASD